MVLRGTHIQRSGPAGFTLRAILVPPDRIVRMPHHGTPGHAGLEPTAAPLVYSFTDTYRSETLRFTLRDIASLEPDSVREQTIRRMVRDKKEVVMSNRYTTIDVIVGVGMCAIVFGALLFFVAATGTFQVAPAAYVPLDRPTGILAGMTMLQPALGQTIVERAVLERRGTLGMAEAIIEWNKATMAQHYLQSILGGPFGAIRHDAASVPGRHAARVQTVMGREIVNFTKRGVRSEMLSANQYFSQYNDRMIQTTEARGRHLDREFASTWQSTLGHRIIAAAQDYRGMSMSIQEQMGRAILQMTHLQATLEERWAQNEYQLASLIVAAVRTDALTDRLTQLTIAEPTPIHTNAVSQNQASLPQMQVGFLAAAAVGLAAIFFAGLTMAATIRERKAMAEMTRNSARWVYRIAA